MEASGDFDYLWEKTDGSDGVDVVDQRHDGFDAFDENTWGESFAPAPRTAWHQSRQARTLLIASATALSAIVVSVVLLVVKGSPAGHAPAPGPATTATTTPLATATSEPPPPPPIPPPPPPPPAPPAVNDAPAVIRPTAEPRTTKRPEINVTRTPATRQPISVAPQPRHPR